MAGLVNALWSTFTLQPEVMKRATVATNVANVEVACFIRQSYIINRVLAASEKSMEFAWLQAGVAAGLVRKFMKSTVSAGFQVTGLRRQASSSGSAPIFKTLPPPNPWPVAVKAALP